jgi:oxaloacetate decarboxylase alpha subunit
VRIDLGYPILVSPFAQFIVTQAMLNVMGGERYRTIPEEVRRYVQGHYGRIAGEVSPEVAERVFSVDGAPSEPFSGRPGEEIAPALPQLRAERGPFDTDDDLLLAAFYSDPELEGLRNSRKRRKPTPPRSATPLNQLLHGLRAGTPGEDVQVQRPGMRVRVVR